MTKRRINDKWPTFKVTLTLVWCPDNSPFPRKEVRHPNDGSTTWEYTVTRLTTKPVKAKDAVAAARVVKNAWRNLFDNAILTFTRVNVTPYEDVWALPYEERQARKLQRLGRIKSNRAKRIRR
jgi:hypothetical protein